MTVPRVGKILLLTACITAVNGLVCLNCDEVAHPILCKHVTTCFRGEKCGLDTLISNDGDVFYKLGCVDTNYCPAASTHTTPGGNHGNKFFACHSCCDNHDLCNAIGCNSTGFPVNRGLVCYNCEAYPGGYPCHRIEHCETHEVCYNDATLEFQTNMSYSSGCRSKHNCADSDIDPIIGFGKRHVTDDVASGNKRSTSVCTDCCAGDLCNVQCKSADSCADDLVCQTLMTNYDVCTTPDVARQFCKKSCSLCQRTNPPCADTRVDCSYIGTVVNMCTSKQKADAYGCVHFCGFCDGSTGRPATQPSHPSTTTIVYLGPLQVGDRVVRGPEWKWNNQDGSGPGTVLSVDPSSGWVTIKWDNTGTTQDYRYGYQGYHDVQKTYAPAATTPSTRIPPGSPPTDGPSIAYLLRNGDIVMRGPDWSWNNQDGNGPGVVLDAHVAPGWVRVQWYNTNVTNSYRMGDQGQYEVQFFSGQYALPSTTSITTSKTTPTTTATTPPAFPAAFIGMRVERGPDWIWNNQDGNGPGTVTDIPRAGWVTVRWDNTGVENSYRNGAENKHDVQPSTGAATTISATATVAPGFPVLKVNDTVVRGPDWMWSNQDGNGTGRVIQVDLNTQGPGYWVTVLWNAGSQNSYRYGVSGSFDIQKAGISTTVNPVSTTMAMTTARDPYAFKVGDRVVRGPDWMWGNQDQDQKGGSQVGVVVGVPPQTQPQWVEVEWPSGYSNTYRVGFGGHWDVQVA